MGEMRFRRREQLLVDSSFTRSSVSEGGKSGEREEQQARGQEYKLQSQAAWVRTPDLSPTSCGPLSKLLNLSMP